MELKKIRLPFKVKKPILAFGSQTKNTLCFAEDDFAYLSTLHPGLNNPKDFSIFEKTAEYFLSKRPKIIAYDLHPEYQSTKFVRKLSAKRYTLYAIQHHHAHIASCMAENGLKNQKIIGVAFDGTGLGIDERFWGAEFLVCDYKNFKRRAHLKEVPLLGGERAIMEPFRLAAIWLYLIYKDVFLNLDIAFVKGLDKGKWHVLKNMYLSGFNSLFASSMGRFFDAAASLILAKYKVSFEAELAIELEKLASSYKSMATSYNFKIVKRKDTYIIDPVCVFREIISDIKAKQPKEKMAYRFHLTVAKMIKKVCLVLRRATGINKAVLSGGVFQNNLLLRLSLNLLHREGFDVFTHKTLSCNDSCVSVGQAVVAYFKAKAHH